MSYKPVCFDGEDSAGHASSAARTKQAAKVDLDVFSSVKVYYQVLPTRYWPDYSQ